MSGAQGIVFWDGVDPRAISAIAEAGQEATLFDGGEGPVYSENPWDVVVIAGHALPGVNTIEGLPTLKIDQKKKGGGDSITLTATGYLPGPIVVSCEIWTKAQWEVFQTVAAVIWRKPNKKSKLKDLAIPIAHPDLALWGISQVVVQGVSLSSKGKVPQARVYKLRLLEYVGNEKTNKTKTAKPTTFERDARIPTLNTPEKPSAHPPKPAR